MRKDIPIDMEPTVAELCEPYDREWATWQDFVRKEKEYIEKHEKGLNDKEV